MSNVFLTSSVHHATWSCSSPESILALSRFDPFISNVKGGVKHDVTVIPNLLCY